MTINIRLAQADDLEKVITFTHSEDHDLMESKIRFARIIIAESEGQLIGLLELEYLWNKTPYINFIEVKEFFRSKGISRKLLEFAENSMRNRGKKMLLSSSQSNEPEPQNWHRAMGFKEAGFLCGVAGEHSEFGEIFFVKSLTAR